MAPFAKRSIRERRGVTSVTMAAVFLDENKTHDDGDNKEEGKKSNRVLLTKHQLCTCITLFCTFLCRRCTTAT